uniref:SHSP domain-containing protein n=1 Tax=Pycnococcus provasolii TaxID=41880 RepID=A0A7S2ARU7_9CHLO|mmetsp:Transcript_167/g.350  ORF Transcript_167/g.350 Transcript_167/m.350 type:complete len:354 (+) Transcript_167:167-1228(+)
MMFAMAPFLAAMSAHSRGAFPVATGRCGGGDPFGGYHPCDLFAAMMEHDSDFEAEDDKNKYSTRISVPGADANSTQVTKHDDGSFHVKVKSADGKRTIFDRRLQLPDDADPTSLRAAVVNGELHVAASKMAKPTPVTVPVSADVDNDDNNNDSNDNDNDNKPYVLRKNVPGVAAEDVQVTVDDDVLRVEARRRGETSTSYKRTFAMPEDAERSGVSATCALGVLTVRIPKKPVPVPVAVPVSDTIPEAEQRHIHLAHLNVPGFKPSDATVEVTRGMLRIKLSKENGEKRERFASLPDSVKNHEHVHAAIANGVMAVWADNAAVREPAEMTVDVSSTPLALDDDWVMAAEGDDA